MTPTQDAPQVAIAVLTWRNEDMARRCLESLRHLAGWPFPTVVVDNGSGTGEGDRLAREFSPDVDALVLLSDEGVPGGYNAGLRWGLSKGVSHVLLLNNDVVVQDPHLISRLMEAIQPDVAAVGPVVHDPDRSIFSAGGRMDWFLGRTRHHRRPLRTSGPYEVEWLDGPCILISLSAVRQIGGLAHVYFMYAEELDWCVRAGRAGYRLLVEPRTSILHERGTRQPSLGVRELTLRNAILFMRRNGTRLQNATSLVWALLYRPLAMAYRCLGRPTELIRIPAIVASALWWNVRDAFNRGSWRVQADGPEVTP